MMTLVASGAFLWVSHAPNQRDEASRVNFFCPHSVHSAVDLDFLPFLRYSPIGIKVRHNSYCSIMSGLQSPDVEFRGAEPYDSPRINYATYTLQDPPLH